MKSFIKKQKKKFSYKEKVTIAVLLVVIVGANTVTIVKAATTWNPSVSTNLTAQNPNDRLVACQATPGYQCGDKNGQRIKIGFYPDLEAMRRYIGLWGSVSDVDNMLKQQFGSAPCVFGYSVINSVTNVSTINTQSCWTVKYVCVSYCEPHASGGKNSVPCSVTLCKDNSPKAPISTDPNDQVSPSTK